MTAFTVICLLAFVSSAAQSPGVEATAHYIQKAEACRGVDSVMAKQGSWKKVEDDLAFPDKTFPRSQYKLVSKRIDSIHSFFKQSIPSLNGIEPRWQRVLRGSSYNADGPVPYTFTTFILEYYCNTNSNKISLGDETRTWAYVFVNHYNWFCRKVDDWDIKGDGKKITVYQLPKKYGVWKERTLYVPDTHGPNARAVVLTHNGKSPWRTLTQKEYLEGLKRKYIADKDKQLAGFVEWEEKKKAQKIPSNLSPEMAAKVKQQIEQDLKNFQAKSETYKAAAAKIFDDEVRYIDGYLAITSAETLSQPAILDPKYNALKFRGTFGTEDTGGTRLIAFSSAYFSRDHGRDVPQFMILYWRWSDSPGSLSFKKQFEEKFPLEKLKAMIDK